MKNNKILKFMAGIGLACVSALSLVGCDDIEVNQNKVDSLIEKGETFVDNHNEIDYKKLSEELQEYLDSQKQPTQKDLYELARKKLLNYFSMVPTQNYTCTYVDDSVVTRYERVEYVSDELTKYYISSYNEQGVVEREVYKEITPTEVTTYVKCKDLKLKTTITLKQYLLCESSLLAFDDEKEYVLKSDDNVDLQNREYVKWKDVFRQYNLGKNSDEQVSLWFGNSNSVFDISLSDYNQFFVSNAYEEVILPSAGVIEYDLQNDKIYIKCNYLGLRSGDYEKGKTYFSKSVMEITDNSVKESEVETINYEGIPGSVKTTKSEYFYGFDIDNQNTINFDITGYQLVSDWYASMENND